MSKLLHFLGSLQRYANQCQGAPYEHGTTGEAMLLAEGIDGSNIIPLGAGMDVEPMATHPLFLGMVA
jgi:hypothetical protein